MNPLVFMAINIVIFLGLAYMINGNTMRGFLVKLILICMAVWHSYYAINETVRQANASLKNTVKAENSQKGYTLIELLIVIAILFVVAIVVALRWFLKH